MYKKEILATFHFFLHTERCPLTACYKSCWKNIAFHISAFQSVGVAFLGLSVDHWCEVPGLKNLTAEQQKYIVAPLDENGNLQNLSNLPVKCWKVRTLLYLSVGNFFFIKFWISFTISNSLMTTYILISGEYSSCEMHNLDYSKYTYDDFLNWNRTTMLPENITTRSCSSWLFDTSEYTSVVNKVCNALI